MVKKVKKICEYCRDNINDISDNTSNNINNYFIKNGINEKNIYYICCKCFDNSLYYVLPNNIDFSYFYLKIFVCGDLFYVLLNEWKDYVKNLVHKKREENRKKEIEFILKEHKLENIKPSLCKSYIKYGIPNIENIILIFKKEQRKKEERLYKLIKELKKYGKEYDENVPVFENYIKEGGDIFKIIEEGELEKSLIYNTNYSHYLKHNSIQTARYLATIEFMNSGKQNNVIKKFASEKNTLNFH
jgi:hypothetical protein